MWYDEMSYGMLWCDMMWCDASPMLVPLKEGIATLYSPDRYERNFPSPSSLSCSNPRLSPPNLSGNWVWVPPSRELMKLSVSAKSCVLPWIGYSPYSDSGPSSSSLPSLASTFLSFFVMHSGLRTGVLADVLTLESREEEEDRLKRDMKLPDPLQGRTWKEKEWRGEKMKNGKE